MSKEYNKGGIPKNKIVWNLMMKQNILKTLFNHLMPNKIRQKIRKKIEAINVSRKPQLDESSMKELSIQFLDEINKQYVTTARAKGLTDNKILYGHVFRNAMLIVIAGMPSALIGIFFTGSMLIEVIFSLDGLGLLGFESVLNRDYPVMFGTLFVFTLLGLILKLISDLTYVFIDPRIDFASREH